MMTRTQRWNNVEGNYITNLFFDHEGELNDENGETFAEFVRTAILNIIGRPKVSLREAVQHLLCKGPQPLYCTQVEVIIYFRSTGMSEPGSMYGGSDNLGWPPYAEDERILLWAEVLKDGLIPIVLPKGVADVLFNRFEDEIKEVELRID